MVSVLTLVKTNKRVKADISRSEQLQFETVIKDTFLGYTDQEEHQLLCYPLEEVLVEKPEALTTWSRNIPWNVTLTTPVTLGYHLKSVIGDYIVRFFHYAA